MTHRLTSILTSLSLFVAVGHVLPAQGQTPGTGAEPSTGAVAAPVPAAAPLSPAQAALRDALDAAGPQLAAVVGVYQQHDFAPVWTAPRAEALLAALDQAGRHGLPAGRYDEALLRGGEPGTPAYEVAMTRAFLTYARDVNSGLLEPRRVDSDIVVSPKRPDPFALLEGLATAPDAAGYLEALAPSHPHYAALQAEKARLEQLVAADIWGDPVPAGPTLRQGDSGPRVAALRRRLAAMESLELGEAPVFDAPLAMVVKAFQRSRRLSDDGVVGPTTLAVLNAQPEDRLKQVLVNLERQRWLNYDRGTRYILVNQAAFTAQLIDQGEVTLDTRVVIGTNEHRTQEFNDSMTYMVVNPTWHVPRSIATEEMLPKLQRNPGALGSSMQIMTRGGTRINPMLVDFRRFTRSNFPFVIKQRPGPGNALGKVKFMFPNQFSIYLHDTPAKHLFGRDVRAYSHGCVRVQKPFELAHALLAPQADDPQGYFRTLLDGGKERRVNLEQPVPIYLTYHSAFVGADGTVGYASDIYGRDARVFEALQAEGVNLGAVEG
ncbi:L,D-transpeptidase family protein [Rhodobacteraceae bacterium 2CG4]|uniref:L,D-transpeptidase family protein n=1 Tax=Halovulum marinum TaxID=2662447 RepID=A0A6L5Z0L0_9RHOB|nr:L,D-transpeptidase family protein [Halovulum marinum]MSU90028.1 L,D-transpeptidase family protein [Halovulum marinum]